MKKSVIFIFAITLIIFGHAQHTTNILGHVVDADSKENIAFANIMIMSDTSSQAKLLNGVTTSQDGTFIIKSNNKNVVMKITSLGYKDNIFIVNVSDYPNDNGSINIGTIYLNIEYENLQEVSIIAKQRRIEIDQDKIVLNIDEGITATSANVFEMLRKVPGVVIDKDENITLQGQGGVLFQFDGRDIRIPYESMKAILKGMSPDNIAKIETIVNPSSKYEAEGTAGIINIVMAKEKTTGFSGDMHSWLGVNKDIKNNTGANLNWVTEKWTISAGASANHFASRNSKEINQYIWGFTGDTTRIHMDETEDKNIFNGLNFDISADYKINDNSSVGAMVSYSNQWSPFTDEALPYMTISKYPYAIIDSSYSNDNEDKFSSYNLMGSVYYNHKLDTLGGQYSIDLDFNHNVSNNTSKSVNNYYYGDMNTMYKQENLYNNADNKYNSYSAKLDVAKPFNNKMTLELGIKSRLAIVDNDFHAYINDINDITRTQTFNYKENVNAAYVSLSNKMTERFSWRAGLRFEHTYTSFDMKTIGEKHSDNYFSLFPSLTLNMKTGKMDNFSMSYSYRISRPDYNSLNPFKTKNSDYMYSSGNPYLNPEYTHNLSFNYAFHYIVFLTAGYSYTDNNINQTMIANPTNLVLTQQPYNNGYSQQFNIGLSSMLPLGPLEWTIWMQGAYSQAKCDDQYLKVDISRFSFMTWQSLSLDFFWKTKLSLSCFYSTGGVQMGGEYDDMLMLSANLSKNFLNKALKVSIGIDNLPKRYFHVNLHNQNYRLDMNMCWQRPQLTVNMSYNFGKSVHNNTLKKLKSDDMDNRKSGESNITSGQDSPIGK